MESIILCGCNSYAKKYYLDPRFEQLPQSIKDELKIMCVKFTEEVGGAIFLEFDEDGELMLRTECDEGDLLYDEIGAGLLIKELQKEKAELMSALMLFYKIFILKMNIEDIDD